MNDDSGTSEPAPRSGRKLSPDSASMPATLPSAPRGDRVAAMTALDALYRVTGRMSLVCDALRRVVTKMKGDKPKNTATSPFDKTGLLIGHAELMPVWWDDEEVIFVKYASLAHSFWRAQEFSLIRNHIGFLKPPVLDFGCGDGSFASVLFKNIDYGVDNDPEAIEIARGYGIYRKLIESSTASIPLERESVRSIVSNSVLEHLVDLEGMIAEFSRILAHGGTLMFTAPVLQFTEDLAKYFGRRESERINAESSHRNLLSPSQWHQLLARFGFVVEVSKPYQPDWFTYWYRMFRLVGRRGLGVFSPTLDEKIWRRFSSRLINMVKTSISSTPDGGNIFVVCRKP